MKTTLFIISILGLMLATHAELAFQEMPQTFKPSTGRGIALGDFNNDDELDAFVISSGGACHVYFGDGNAAFSDSKMDLSAASNWWGRPVIGDINQDGYLDVVTGEMVWINNGKGQLIAKKGSIEVGESDRLGSVALGDLNGDGYPDLFAISNYSGSRVFLNDKNGLFKPTHQKIDDGLAGTGQIAEVALGDINQDGYLDGITVGWKWNGSTECPNHVWINDGNGNFSLDDQLLDEGPAHAHGVVFGDLNNDGSLDLVIGLQARDRSGSVYLNNGSGKFIKKSDILGKRGEKVALADFDDDGDLDILGGWKKGVQIWLNDGNGAISNDPISFGENCGWDVAAGDFNKDGRIDVFSVGFDWSKNQTKPSAPQVFINLDEPTKTNPKN